MVAVRKDESGVCDPQITQIFAEHRGQSAWGRAPSEIEKKRHRLNDPKEFNPS